MQYFKVSQSWLADSTKILRKHVSIRTCQLSQHDLFMGKQLKLHACNCLQTLTLKRLFPPPQYLTLLFLGVILLFIRANWQWRRCRQCVVCVPGMKEGRAGTKAGLMKTSFCRSRKDLDKPYSFLLGGLFNFSLRSIPSWTLVLRLSTPGKLFNSSLWRRTFGETGELGFTSWSNVSHTYLHAAWILGGTAPSSYHYQLLQKFGVGTTCETLKGH